MTDAILDASRRSIERGSGSFAAAARLFDPKIRDDAYHLYAWCRHCDDEVDGQVMGHGAVGIDPAQARLKLAELEDKTRRALAGEPMPDPAFAAFQRVARGRGLSPQHPLDLLEGFRMDVEPRPFRTLDDTLRYAYHVAGVVGVMMAEVMGVKDPLVLGRAADLGLAFQLTNISRDVLEDARGGRVYLPSDWLGGLGAEGVADPANREAVFKATVRLLDAAEPYYVSARWGLFALGFRSAWAVAAALGIYRRIGSNVRAGGPAGMERRASTGALAKASYALLGGALALRATTLDRRLLRPKAPAIWSFPEEGARSAWAANGVKAAGGPRDQG
jgi:phytoene synthase